MPWISFLQHIWLSGKKKRTAAYGKVLEKLARKVICESIIKQDKNWDQCKIINSLRVFYLCLIRLILEVLWWNYIKIVFNFMRSLSQIFSTTCSLANLSYKSLACLWLLTISYPPLPATQQRDTLGPLLFTLNIDDIVCSITTLLNI